MPTLPNTAARRREDRRLDQLQAALRSELDRAGRLLHMIGDIALAQNRPTDALPEYQEQGLRAGDAADLTSEVGNNEAGYLAPSVPHPSQRGEAC